MPSPSLLINRKPPEHEKSRNIPSADYSGETSSKQEFQSPVQNIIELAKKTKKMFESSQTHR